MKSLYLCVMLQNFIKNYQNYSRQFEHELESSLIHAEVESIHQMRVAVKKLRALSKFLESVFKKELKTKKHYRYHRKVFKAAAAIRHVDIFTSLLSNYQSEEIQTEKVLSELFKTRKKFVRLYYKAAYRFKKKAFKNSSDFLEKLKKVDLVQFRDKVSRYLKNSADDLCIKSHNALGEEDFHKVRIRMKAFIVLLSTCCINEFQALIYDLKKTSDILGTRHDKIDLYSYLKKTGKKTKDPKKKRLCKNVQRQILSETESEKDGLRKIIIDRVENVKKAIYQFAQN